MTLSISKRSDKIVQSEIRNMSLECDRVGGINLSQGICDLELPEPVRIGACEAIKNGVNHYTRYDGLPELRNAIARKLAAFNHLVINPKKNIIVSGGSTGALYSACLAILNPGDEVILFEPFYGYHVNTLLAVDAVPVYVRLNPPDWNFKINDLEAVVTPRTKGIMINTPSNPCGKVFTTQEIDTLADFATRHDIFIFTDEIYEYFVYDGREHISPASFPSIADRTIMISGYSKTFSITGWRLGYAVCDEKWAQMIGYINDLVYVCGAAPLQMGVAKGIMELPPEYYKGLCKTYFLKREQLCSVLQQKSITPYVPQGAYYVLADVSSLPGKTSKERAMYILNKVGVASVPGSAFYHDSTGENLVRFCFAKNSDVLQNACEQLMKL